MADKILIVSVSGRTLSRILGYKDGAVRNVRLKYEDGFSIIDVAIEHESGIEVIEGDHIPVQDLFRERY